MRVFGFGNDGKIAQYQRIGKWLAARPELWAHKKIERGSPDWKTIAKAVKAAGFYSIKTVDVDIKVDKLLVFAKREYNYLTAARV